MSHDGLLFHIQSLNRQARQLLGDFIIATDEANQEALITIYHRTTQYIKERDIALNRLHHIVAARDAAYKGTD